MIYQSPNICNWILNHLGNLLHTIFPICYLRLLSDMFLGTPLKSEKTRILNKNKLILRRSLRKTKWWPLVSLLKHCLHNCYESPPALDSWLILWLQHAFRRFIRKTTQQMVTHPITNLYLCCLTSNSSHSTIFPLSYWYSSKNKVLEPCWYSCSSSLCCWYCFCFSCFIYL